MLNHSHSVNNPVLCPFLLSACGLFHWTDNRVNEHMCHLILNHQPAGKKKKQSDFQQSFSQAWIHTHALIHAYAPQPDSSVSVNPQLTDVS